ncbi:hypothetical protein FQN53_000250 [Emmonsiellopsis sp. PD_33]|nr:hypothetical protein FQN53_000250 [Emmonsiellopsis sp. PD_33]
MDPPRRSRRLAEQDPESHPLPPPTKRQKISQTTRASSQATAPTNGLGDPPDHADARDIIASYTPSILSLQDQQLAACLNAFLDVLPLEGATVLANDILQCGNDHDKLFEVFENLRTALLVPMKSASHTPSVASSPLESGAEKTPEQRFRDDCLRRDGYKCVVTKVMDRGRWKEIGWPEDQLKGSVTAAHVIPFSYAKFADREATPKGTSPQWEVLYRYFPFLKKIMMDVSKVNDLSNRLTLHRSLHTEFRSFRISFEPMEEINTFRIKTCPSFDSCQLHGLPKDWILRLSPNTVDSQDGLQPFNSNLLAVHFVIFEPIYLSKRPQHDLADTYPSYGREDSIYTLAGKMSFIMMNDSWAKQRTHDGSIH